MYGPLFDSAYARFMRYPSGSAEIKDRFFFLVLVNISHIENVPVIFACANANK